MSNFLKPTPGSYVRVLRKPVKTWRHPTERTELIGVVQPDAPNTRARHFVITVDCPKVPFRTIDLDNIEGLEHL
jgi:hypothetical protein